MHREHRGHRLGLATKAVNLRAVQAARGDLTLVITQNAEANDYMVAINDKMGFHPIEVSAEFVKRLCEVARAASTTSYEVVAMSDQHRMTSRAVAARPARPADVRAAQSRTVSQTAPARRSATSRAPTSPGRK